MWSVLLCAPALLLYRRPECYVDYNEYSHKLFHFQKQTLMQHVLRCDYEACRQYLVNLEQAFLLDQGSQALGALLGHRCDGNRNILHAAVSVCFPVSNKETKEEEGKWVCVWLWTVWTKKSFRIDQILPCQFGTVRNTIARWLFTRTLTLISIIGTWSSKNRNGVGNARKVMAILYLKRMNGHTCHLQWFTPFMFFGSSLQMSRKIPLPSAVTIFQPQLM